MKDHSNESGKDTKNFVYFEKNIQFWDTTLTGNTLSAFY